MKKSLKSISIYGFLGKQNVHIPFDDENKVKILVGENGIGKTQILNIIYYTLTSNISKLFACQFEKIEFTFEKEIIEIDISKISKLFASIWNNTNNASEKYKPDFDRLKEYFSEGKLKVSKSFTKLLAARLFPMPEEPENK